MLGLYTLRIHFAYIAHSYTEAILIRYENQNNHQQLLHLVSIIQER